MDNRQARFFRWYRTVPIVLMAGMLALSLCVGFLPLGLVRSLFFPVTYAERIDDAAERHNVDPHLVAAVIRCESGWNETAQSGAGAVGLMQIMPETSKTLASLGYVDPSRYDPNDLLEPRINIEYGTALLSYLEEQLSTTDEVIAAYNAGLSTVRGWIDEPGSKGIPDAITYPETRHYVERVREAMRQYQKYYPNGMSVL